MNSRTVIVLLILIALAVGGWALFHNMSAGGERLVPAWGLLAASKYKAVSMTDPFVSWSPDSRMLVLSAYEFRSRSARIYRWNVGEKKLRPVTAGSSPNFVSVDKFLYLKPDPKAVFLRSLSTSREHEVMPEVKKSAFWEDVTGIMYDPARKAVALRLAEFTHYYTPGSEEYDLSGKRLGDAETRTSEGILDWSRDPKSSRCALLVREQDDEPITLQIAGGQHSRGAVVASGDLGAVSWSPNGDTIAYGDSTSVIALRPSDGKCVTVGAFPDPKNPEGKRDVVRLSWSPNGQYLAAMVYVRLDGGDYPLIYVLDMSKFKWDR